MAPTELHHGRAGGLGRIELLETDFAELATGGGASDVIRRLRAGERSRRLVMLKAFLDMAQDSLDAGALSPVTQAWDALERAEACDPDAVTEVLMHPQVGNWLAYTLRRHRGGARSATPFIVDVAQFQAVAIAACAATGQAYSAEVPLREGRVMLPTFGMATFPGRDVAQVATEDGRIWLWHGDVRVSVPPDGSDAPGWWALRRVTVGADLELRVWLDDLDPMRDLADPVPPMRLSAAEFQRWETLLRDAWAILVARHRPTAEALAAGVTSLVPLPAGDGWDTRSASTGEAFGAIMCSPPPDAVTLAVSLAHEFMHIKLGGLMHLFSLTDGTGRPWLYAPWRDDPRPAGGLLQGIYAFFGIAAFWRRERSAMAGTLGDFEYAYARAQTHEALSIAVHDGGLTEHGRRFAEQLGDEMRRWSDDDLDPEARRLVALVADGHRTGWRIRHGRPRPEDVAALARAWEAGGSAGVAIGASEVLPDPQMRHWSAARLGLARRWVIAPDRRQQAPHEAWGHTLTDADLALYSGEPAKAAAGFVEQIRVDPESADAWTGLGLALHTDPEAPALAAVALLTRPEVVLAVHREITMDHSPVELAAWIGSCLPVR